MILHALYELYCRLRDDPDVEIDIPGMSKAKVSFELVISPEGELKGVTDLRRQEGNKFFPVELMVPQQNKRTSGDSPYLLCDKADYLLGLGSEGVPDEASLRRFAISAQRHEAALAGVEEARPVLRFFGRWKPEQALEHACLKDRAAELAGGGTLVFRLAGEAEYIHQKQTVRDAAGSYMEGAVKADESFCLVTGEHRPVSKVHNSIKGVRDAQSSGAALVSFNCEAFESYGKEQSINAPVGVDVARGYVAALNWLLADRRHKVQLGDATTVFWAEAPQAENLIFKMLGQDWEEDRQDVESVEAREQLNGILTRLSRGMPVTREMLGFDPGVKVYILGLSPNNSRLSVRFWHRDSFGAMVERVARHYADMALERQFENQEPFLPLPRLLKEMAARGDMDNLPDTMTGGLLRAILTGGPYPQGVYAAMIGRIRANDGGKDARGNALNPVTYGRVSVIKAVLLRKARIQRKKEEECLTMSLKQTTDTAYRLGRLFALLEKAQQDANPGINSTIRDRYFATASASPASAFPTLLRLAQHHLKKSDYGVSMNRRIGEVVDGIEGTGFPARLNLEEQGKFILGYYHQRQNLYTKKSEEAKGEETNEDA